MKPLHIRKNIPFVIATASIVLLFISVVYLMNYVQDLFSSDIRINLNEIATQNKNVVTSKIALETGKLNLIASQISDELKAQKAYNDNTIEKIFLKYLTIKQDNSLFFADGNGIAYVLNSKNIDIAGRNYYRLAIQGKTNVSDRLISRIDGKDVFILSVPIEYNDYYVGTVQKVYTIEEMFEICRLSLFSNEGTMYIVNSEGYILITSQQGGKSIESENYTRKLYTTSPDAAKQMDRDIKNGRAGFIEAEDEHGKFFSTYTPIDQIYNWYLISSIPTSVVSKNANTVFNMFYFILCMIVIVFAFVMAYIWYTKQKQHKQLKTVAFVDTITGGNTYNKFISELKVILSNKPDIDLYLVMMDIDKFKYINNFYGFEFGDRLLSLINKTIEQYLMDDEMIAHIYSDHFILLLKDVSKERLDVILDSTINLLDIRIYMTAGIYKITDYSESINLMVDKASVAAKTVKVAQYKRIGLYSEDYDKQMIRNENTKREVDKAIAENVFVPFFQPKVDINTRQLIGAEALVRWPTKEGKLISPGEFIPVCENTGQIVFIDMIIFEKTLRFLRDNMDSGISCVPISVNFSRLHLQNDDFVEKLAAKLQEYNVPPFLVEIEVTESVMLESSEAIMKFIEEAHKRNLQISMDDFGAGYSSLSMLKDMQIDVLKIDGGFLRDTVHNDRQKTIFSAIAKMAKKLNMKVVVEGVETIEHVELMHSLGCYTAQGYYFSKPLEQNTFEKIYREGYL